MARGPFCHRVQCAAITRGCLNSLAWEDNLGDAQYVNERLLTLNGWRKDHGRWICGNHPQAKPA
jgi:hypothetical protein